MIEKGTLRVGDVLVGKFKGEVYHVSVRAKNGDGTLVYEAIDGPAAETQFKSVSAAGKAITGHECNGWSFWSVEGKEPVKTPRVAKPKGAALVERFQCPDCTHIFQTAAAAKRCLCQGAKAARLVGTHLEPVSIMIDPMAPAKAAAEVTREPAQPAA
jgi:hypothetical protein